MSSPETEKCCSPKPSGRPQEKPQPERSGRELSERRFLSQAAAFHTPMSSLRESASCLERLRKLPLKKHHETQRYTLGTTDLGCVQELRGQHMSFLCDCVCMCMCWRGTGYACLQQEAWKTQEKNEERLVTLMHSQHSPFPQRFHSGHHRLKTFLFCFSHLMSS